MAQNDEIIAYIREHGSITPLDAIRDIGCLRLASRISELKRDGFHIKMKMERHKKPNGKVVRYARYFM